MIMLYAALAALSVVLAAAIGFYCGLRASELCLSARRAEGKHFIPDGAETRHRGVSAPSETGDGETEDLLLRISEEQKAFADCMNYSAETAYGWEGHP